ncbi:MAG: NAD(P)/FAD-dependent oxidoreductase [Solirubrobacteraceae bacterium]
MPNWWLRQATPIGPISVLEGARRADVCIIGGGFTGLWTALRIKQREPRTEVVVLEAGLCGSGASGRNGGFGLSFWHHFIALEQICGTAEAVRLARASADAVGEIGSFCAEYGIDAHYRAAGWMWTATSSAQLGAWESTLAAIERAGERPFAQLDVAAVAARTGSSAHLAGVYEQTSATIQPALLARGLMRVARELGVAVYERSPMVALQRSTPLQVRTPHGRVDASCVVIATGAWALQLRELRRAFVIVASDIVLTEPVPDELQRCGWSDGVSISDSRLMVHYYRTTRDGRIAFGKGGGRLAYGGRVGHSFNERSPIEAEVTAELRKVYPRLTGRPIAASWAGPIDRTVDGLPFFHELGRPDLICGAGYSGNGVVASVLGGRILASMALGRQDEWSRCGLVRRPAGGMPGEPWRYVGGSVVRGAVARKERAEDAQRPVARVDRALTRLAPAGLVPVKR